MIRDMRRNGAQPKNTMRKAKVALVTGMGVVLDGESYVALPTAETVENIYVATKERIADGCKAAFTELSDYDEAYVNIDKDEFLGLERYTDGEKFATDQYLDTDFTDGLTEGTAVAVGTDGKWIKATKASKYQFAGFHTDNSHKLIMIRVEADAVSNA